MRWATLVVLALLGCNDLREFHGDWRGPRVGDADDLRRNVGDGPATLAIDHVDSHRLRARLTIEGLLPETPIASLAGAEADVLADLTFAGAPLRVYLAFAAMPTGGESLVVVALYDDRRIEVRMLRGGATPLYGIYALSETP